MSHWYQKLCASKDRAEASTGLNEIYKAIEADPAGMREELKTAYQEAREAEEAATEAYRIALNVLNEAETIENKAAAWDAHWKLRNAIGITAEILEAERLSVTTR